MHCPKAKRRLDLLPAMGALSDRGQIPGLQQRPGRIQRCLRSLHVLPAVCTDLFRVAASDGVLPKIAAAFCAPGDRVWGTGLGGGGMGPGNKFPCQAAIVFEILPAIVPVGPLLVQGSLVRSRTLHIFVGRLNDPRRLLQQL